MYTVVVLIPRNPLVTCSYSVEYIYAIVSYKKHHEMNIKYNVKYK